MNLIFFPIYFVISKLVRTFAPMHCWMQTRPARERRQRHTMTHLARAAKKQRQKTIITIRL